ncbi:hypothetical protein Tco_1232092 [Tanacetum coccineum]
MLLMTDEEEDMKQMTEAMQEDAMESGDISILNSLVEHGSPQWLQLWGALGDGKVHILIDNCSTHNFVQPGVVEHMKLPLTENDYTLKGEESLRMKQISLRHMRALLETDEIYGVYELYQFANEEHTSNTSATVVETHPKISQLLTRFETLFQVPTTLPPHCSIDHRIHLYLNTRPMNVRPYRYPHYQKGEMEKLIKEMLSQGIIRG